jgi:uncharacterized protein involved in exopolysaccharide biosynthesis
MFRYGFIGYFEDSDSNDPHDEWAENRLDNSGLRQRKMDNRDHGCSNAACTSFAFRYAKFISAAAVVSGIIVIAYSIVSEPVYTAYCQVLVDPGISKIGRENSLEQGGTPDTQRVESEIAVIKSDGVALAVIDKLKISPRADFFDFPFVGAFKRSNNSDNNATEQTRRLALAQFRESLTVRRIGVSDAIAIGFSASTADQAAERANATAEAYMKFQLEARAQAARVSSDWLQHRLFNIRLEMNRAELKLQEFRAAQNYSLNNKRLAAVSAQRLGDVPERPPGATGDAGDLESMTLEELETNAAAHRKVYETFLQAYMTTVQDQSFPIPNARLISRAEPPMHPNRNVLFAIGAAMFLGGIGGMSLRIWQLRNAR